MKTEEEIREKIKDIDERYAHVIKLPLAIIQINAPRALMQIDARNQLDALYWVLGEKRPKSPMDGREGLE